MVVAVEQWINDLAFVTYRILSAYILQNFKRLMSFQQSSMHGHFPTYNTKADYWPLSIKDIISTFADQLNDNCIC